MPAWIFQGNPDVFDLDRYLRDAQDITWTVRQKHFADRIRVGDRVFMWRAQGNGSEPGGVIAAGHVTRAAAMQRKDAADARYWKKHDATESLMVGIHVERVAEKAKEVVKREWLKDDPVLSGLRILKMANETNFELSPEHTRRLEALWRNTGRDWNETESLAGLWAYSETLGGEVSRLRDSPVAKVALKIGRAVTGVYNKVMNFRALDPRDDRDGLTGGSATDLTVWGRYFDVGSNRLDTKRLQADFRQVWDASDSPPMVPVAEPEPRTSARGQGYESDPRVRKAVEERAMLLASAHYKDKKFAIEVTADKYPFDLRCRKAALEVRVEVKGTRGDGSTVEMTIAEIENARGDGWRTDLFIVSEIEVVRDGVAVEAVGGTKRVFESWKPSDGALMPIRFRVRV